MKTNIVQIDQINAENQSLKAKIDELIKKIESWVQELKRRNLEADLLNRLSFALQRCQTTEEIYNQLAQYAFRLFLEKPGELFIYNEYREVYEKSKTWGDIHKDPVSLRKEYCQSLQGTHNCSFYDGTEAYCLYHQTIVEDNEKALPYICSPLLYKEQVLGILHQHVPTIAPLLQEESWLNNEHWVQLAVAVSERLSNALINLQVQQKKNPQQFRDPLTQLFNRWYMQETLERELHYAKRHRTPLWIYYLDIDRMKRVNESYGFEIGNEVLRRVSSFLQNHIRAEDVVCRSGGDEFTMLFLGMPDQIAFSRAQKLREGIKDLQVKFPEQLFGGATCSFGLAGFPVHGENGSDLLLAAGRALQQAKTSGRDQVQIAY